MAEGKAVKAQKAQLEMELKELTETKLRAMAEIDAQEELDDEGEDEEYLGGSAGHDTSTDEADDMDIDSFSDNQAAIPDGGRPVPAKQKVVHSMSQSTVS